MACDERRNQTPRACRYIFLWIALSIGVILANEHVLVYSGFPYPVALTMFHMALSSVLAAALVYLGFVEAPPLTVRTYKT